MTGARPTVARALRDAAAALDGVSETARLDAELLMAHALECTRSDLLLRRMQDTAPGTFAPLQARRAAGEPVAHIIGTQEFFGLPFKVTPATLVPRADSETLIDAALEMLSASPPAHILDCGTGPGTLLLAALSQWNDASGIGIERSNAALAVARENAELLGLAGRCEMRSADWHAKDWAKGLGAFDLVLANPPYVEIEDPDLAPDVRAHEPAEALFAGPDGLDDYRALLPQLPAVMTRDGLAIVEIGRRQAHAVCSIGKASGLIGEVREDLSGNPRAIIFRRT